LIFFINLSLLGGKEVSEKELLYGKEQERTTTMCPPLKQPAATSGERTIEVFYSFRSPYSQLVIPRLKKISSKYSCSISIRPMLPMVTRGLPVPPEKERYIIMDSAREARLWGIPFGKIIDPRMLILTFTPYYPAVVHPGRIPFLRALDAFEVASDNGLGIDFVESFGTNQWGNGISAGTDSGLQLMMKQANMTRDHMDQVFETIQKYSPEERFAHWENRTAENRSYLLSRGLWGVPCLKFREVILFGQDKLWAIEKMVSLEDARERGLEVSEEDDRLSQSILKYAGQG
jgi:2-hydroxychromene-2-carboxylate isomerase